MGRSSKYETHVKSRFDEIRKWVQEGATDKEVMKALGVTVSTFYDYMHKYPEFAKLMREGRSERITELVNTLYKKAIGFQYEEVEEIVDEDGNVRTRTIRKTSLPSETAALILLKHWDKNEDGSPKWSNDPATFELKKKELELKKENFEISQW